MILKELAKKSTDMHATYIKEIRGWEKRGFLFDLLFPTIFVYYQLSEKKEHFF